MLSQIDLVLTLEEHLPECIHQRVIQKEPISVFPNTIPSACYCLRVVMQFLCVCCSAVFFNTNHFRYWTFIFNPRARKADNKFEEIARIVEKARFNSSEEASGSWQISFPKLHQSFHDVNLCPAPLVLS